MQAWAGYSLTDPKGGSDSDLVVNVKADRTGMKLLWMAQASETGDGTRSLVDNVAAMMEDAHSDALWSSVLNQGPQYDLMDLMVRDEESDLQKDTSGSVSRVS